MRFFKKISALLFSNYLMVLLFVVFALAMGIATFIENDFGTETARVHVYNAWWFELTMVLFMVNFLGNISKYKLYRKEKWSTLLFHLSFVFIILGAGITRYISFEGIMPIKEGELSSTFLSEKTYLNIIVDSNKEQKTDLDKPVLLSSFGGIFNVRKNPVDYKSKFRATPYSVTLIGYNPNVEDVFKESESGDTYLLIVESSSGSRHDHYIKKGTSEIIHDVSIGFDSSSVNTIDFISSEEGMLIKSNQAGTFLRMRDQFQGQVVKDSIMPLNLLSLHSVAGLQFVIPKSPIKGSYKTIKKSKNDASALKELIFKINVDGVVDTVKIRGKKFLATPPSQFTVGSLNFRLGYGSKETTLPFGIKLNDFQLEKYPGSENPMSFASEITVFDTPKIFNYRIFMNHILQYKGYRFFQSSYNITDTYEETHLSVSHDFWGTLFTYIGYFLLFFGIVVTLFIKQSRFQFLNRKLKSLRNKKLSLVITAFLMSASFGFSQSIQKESSEDVDKKIKEITISKAHAKAFSKLVIQDAEGRMKPVHTFASEFLRKVSKKDQFKEMNATQVFAAIQQNPPLWFHVPIIYLERGNRKLRTIIGINEDEKYAKFADFFDASGNFKLATYHEEAIKKNIKSKFETDVLKVTGRVNLFYSTLMGEVLRIFPDPNSLENKWVSSSQLHKIAYKGADSIHVKKMLPAYFSTLDESVKTGDYTQSSQIMEGLINFQKKHGKAVYPSERKVNLEIAYNTYDVFRSLYTYYMLIGLLTIILVIVQIFRNSKLLKILIRIGIIAIIVLFLTHTSGLVARWIISGHAPWSNGYESMIYVAWATMLAGIIFGKKSRMTIAATAFLTAFILMIAHWNWMDPAIENLVPVLDSYWLMIHVSIIVASYGPFALGMLLGLIGLLLIILTNKKNKKRIETLLTELTIINEMSLTIGLIMLAVGNFLGAMWANESWGRYWGWDPKETWALVSIMVYALILHFRLIPKLNNNLIFNSASVISFASVLMTYFGVNFYLSGLHSYASGDKIITPTFVYYSATTVLLLIILATIQYRRHYRKR